MLLDQYEEPLIEDERAALENYDKQQLSTAIKRACVSIGGLVLSCGAVVPFSAGHELNKHWVPFARLLLYLCELMLLISLYYSILTYYAWKNLRALRKTTTG